MNGCEEVREILVAAARGERVSAPGQQFLREHVEECPPCRRRLANERMLSAGLAAMASAQAGTPSPAVRTALMAEFRRQHTVVPIRRAAVKTMLNWGAITAAAAALLLAIFVATERRAENAPEKVMVPPRVQVAEVTQPAVPPVVPAPVPKAKVHPTRRRPPIPAPPLPVEDPPEVATDFFAIPYAEPLRPEERADVFRMEMPRASMAAFGLPVAGGRLDARITADVLMGEDGVARAIRFIR